MSVSETMDTNQSENAKQVMESLGEPAEAADHINDAGTLEGTSNNTNQNTDPLYVEKRLKRQSRQHEREMREMQARLDAMQSQMHPSQAPAYTGNSTPSDSSDDVIQRAVNAALSQREMTERKQKEAENAAYMQKQYKGLQAHLDNMSDKYDDFHEKVFDDGLPITTSMRDYAMTLPRKGNGSAGEVLYHLANHPDEMKRISKLHPLDQATEMAKLSHALISGSNNKAASSPAPIGHIKSMPVSQSGSINDKTPVSSIRAKMKSGGWK